MTYTMRPSLVLSTSLLTCALFLFACDNDEPGEGGAEDMSSTPDMMTDAGMTPDVDMSVGDDGGDTPDLPVIEPDMPADMMVDAGEDMAGQDMAEQVTCDPFPTPALSQEAAAVALAANPARCQQPAYQWLDDATLGDVIQTVEGQTYDALTLNLLVGASGVELPVQLDYDVEISTIEYVTQDRGQLTTATAFVAAPVPKEGQEQHFKTLVYLHGTSGFSDGCGPSNDEDTLLLSAAIASTGYVIVGPDYLGMKSIGDPSPNVHPYLVGESVAMSSIDAVRAVGKMGLFEDSGTCAEPELLLLGGSQGGHAALWFDRLLPYYAPEFELLGTVATVPPADLVTQTTRALTSPVQASANVMAFWGSSGSWYGLDGSFSEVFKTPYDVDIPMALRTECDPSDAIQLDVMDLSAVFTDAALGWTDTLAMQPTWGCMAVENGLVTTSVDRLDSSPVYADTYGIFWVMGEEDRLVNTPIERNSFETLCGEGMAMQYLECEGASHTGATAWALPEILEFVEARELRQPMPTAEEGLCELTAPQRCRATME